MARLRRGAAALAQLLRAKYGPPAFVYLSEIGNVAGFAGRRLDAVAMGLFPSRGCQVLGFEIKAYRGDWLRELKTPSKAEPFFEKLDGFYIVANDDVVHDGELPPGWGLIEPYGRGLRVMQKSNPGRAALLDRYFVAAMMAKLLKADTTVRAAERVNLLEQGVELGKSRALLDRQSLRSLISGLRQRIQKFEEASGVSIDDYRAEDIGRAVKLVLDSGAEGYERQVRLISRQLKSVAGNLDRLLDGEKPDA